MNERCPCGDRLKKECPGEWEPGCDLGANPLYARVARLDEVHVVGKGGPVNVFTKDYVGFESTYDLGRDVEEALSPDFNALAKHVPAEFSGVLRVTMTFFPSKDDKKNEH